jgi:malate dehydrogenase (oxaloacetate-decarboxylating)
MTTTSRTTSDLHGRALLRDPHHNRGTAFTLEERSTLGLEGLLPPAVMTLDQQARRSYDQYSAQPTDLAKNTFLAALHDRNDIDGVEVALRNFGLHGDDVDLLVATDAEQILGIGDWGTNGIAISIGKLAVYTAAAGIHPGRVIPVMLDAGTDRESLLNDPLYVGNRHSRARGERYDRLIAAYVETAGRLFPNALLHFEDFGPSNARRILNQYRDKARIFNDDIQGTGAITLAAILAGMRVAASRPSDQRVVIFGAGTAGVGIADQIRAVMVADGLSEDEATQRFWLVDKQGLLVDEMGDLRDFQRPYARPASEVDGTIGLLEVVASAKPTVIVGTSTAGGAFTEQIVREMARHVQRPMIFPLSNPTDRIEAVPADLIKWTDGRALVGTGTPWEPVTYKAIDYAIGQANNALIYPGIGLGTIVARAGRVTDGMLLAAAEAIAALVDAGRPGAGLLPEVENLRAVSATVAVAVAKQAIEDGVAEADLPDPVQAVQDSMWQATYPSLDVK